MDSSFITKLALFRIIWPIKRPLPLSSAVCCCDSCFSNSIYTVTEMYNSWCASINSRVRVSLRRNNGHPTARSLKAALTGWKHLLETTSPLKCEWSTSRSDYDTFCLSIAVKIAALAFSMALFVLWKYVYYFVRVVVYSTVCVCVCFKVYLSIRQGGIYLLYLLGATCLSMMRLMS